METLVETRLYPDLPIVVIVQIVMKQSRSRMELDIAMTLNHFLSETIFTYSLRSEKAANFAWLGDEILAFHRNVMSS